MEWGGTAPGTYSRLFPAGPPVAFAFGGESGGLQVAPLPQSANRLNCSPTMPGATPPTLIPAEKMDPLVVVTKGRVPPFPGSRFGTIHGFTHRGWTGITVPDAALPTRSEFEELKASAVAVALTLAPRRPQIRAKKVGRSVRWTCTVTSGFTPKAGVALAHPAVSVLLGNDTVTVPAAPPTLFCWASWPTDLATCAAVAQADCQVLPAFAGSPVIPEIERIRAAASAAASADRCASALAR